MKRVGCWASCPARARTSATSSVAEFHRSQGDAGDVSVQGFEAPRLVGDDLWQVQVEELHAGVPEPQCAVVVAGAEVDDLAGSGRDGVRHKLVEVRGAGSQQTQGEGDVAGFAVRVDGL
ncbi:hypothetical protein [Streptomyces sp. S1A1-7]|uniref:hypothetical protein n=1 Tax=Streptomyces sp. S1A1-7 TaxID=2594459 RepID=UPI0013E00354|nr:hypothetical protein [Streptomyces sp. S1A1-7]